MASPGLDPESLPPEERGLIVTSRRGMPLVLRPVRPTDKPRFQAGLAELSPASRHYRFLVGLRRFTPQQLVDLTEIDPATQSAWVATDPSRPGLPGVGVGRYVLGRRHEADLALTVLDRFQHSGVGRLILAVLVLSAHARGVRTFVGDVAQDNAVARDWFKRLGGDIDPGPTREAADRLYLPLNRDRLLRQLLG